jgi:hypothetical protein
LRERVLVAIIKQFRTLPAVDPVFRSAIPQNRREVEHLSKPVRMAGSECGQVAQVVERSPEKAGVGGSTPSLATIFSIANCESP